MVDMCVYVISEGTLAAACTRQLEDLMNRTTARKPSEVTGLHGDKSGVQASAKSKASLPDTAAGLSAWALPPVQLTRSHW